MYTSKMNTRKTRLLTVLIDPVQHFCLCQQEVRFTEPEIMAFAGKGKPVLVGDAELFQFGG